MQESYYNSWLSYYKRPFGAQPLHSQVTFTIALPQNCQATLVVQGPDAEYGQERYPMKKLKEQHYTCEYHIKGQPGLYFYYFEISQENQGIRRIQYYGAGTSGGGVGQLYLNEHEVQPYQLTCYEKDDPAPAWYLEGVVYQIFPDRFFNGNEHKTITNPKENIFIYGRPTDEPLYVKNQHGDIIRWDFYGGNLQGIRQKIPYLKKLGVTVVYVNPIFQAASNHRYDTADYFAIDEMLGSEKDFVQLIEALHENGMYLILDGVFSHVGRNSRYFNYDGRFGATAGAYQTPASPYYEWFTFMDYPDNYKSWWGIQDLPEVNKDQRSFQEFIYGDYESVLSKWNRLKVDGWRLDVADELPDTFIAGIRHNLDSYQDRVLLGEVWEDASNKIAYGKRRQYILEPLLHGVMNYPFRKIILDFLTQQKNAQNTSLSLMTMKENYPPKVLLNNLNNIGTHDTRRIFTELKEEAALVNLACGLMFMLPGVPCIYYGDEAGVTGETDPNNRKFFPWEHINPDLYHSYQKWIKVRKEIQVLQRGEFVPFYSQELLGICRYDSSGYALYLLNPALKKQKVEVAELNFAGESPLPYEKLVSLLAGLELKPRDGYLVTESWGADGEIIEFS